MHSSDTALIADIYKASVNSEQWTELLDRLTRQVGAKGCALLTLDLSGMYDYQVTFGNSLYPPALMRKYEQEYAIYEEDHFRRVAGSVSDSIQYDEDFERASHSLIDRPDIDFLKDECGVSERIAVKVSNDDSWFDCLTFQYSSKRGNITSDEISRLQLYLPHLAEAAVLARCFRLLREKFGAVLGVLDRISTGLILVNQHNQIILSNKNAQRILSLRDGLSTNLYGELIATDATVGGKLSHVVRKACETSCNQGNFANAQLSVSRNSSADPYLVDVSPMRDPDNELDSSFRGALVTIVDPDIDTPIVLDGFSKIYNLSKAEEQVTTLLVDGLKYGEIADHRGVSVDTVKTQVKSIYNKVKVVNRSQLIRRALRVALPVSME